MNHRSEMMFIGVSRMRNDIYRKLDSIFRSYGLTLTQFSVLEVLYSKGDLCIKDIQDLILGTPGNIPVVIQNLEKQSYIERYSQKNDKRISMIRLTKSGYSIVEKVYPLQQQKLDDIFSVFDSEEEREFLRLLLKFYKKQIKEKKDDTLFKS